MTTRTFGYWATTGLLGLAFAAGGAADLSGAPEVMSGMAHLGYPAYFAVILGGWKLLGALAVLVPGLPRLKEWAYAGMAFDLTGAAISHAVVGDGIAKVSIPLFLFGLAVASWALRPTTRKLTAAANRVAAGASSQSLEPGIPIAA
jgi:uncharacterized membrane protein YphA (DoxX/SURF4 family)